jgi:hypothetical protein
MRTHLHSELARCRRPGLCLISQRRYRRRQARGVALQARPACQAPACRAAGARRAPTPCAQVREPLPAADAAAAGRLARAGRHARRAGRPGPALERRGPALAERRQHAVPPAQHGARRAVLARPRLAQRQLPRARRAGALRAGAPLWDAPFCVCKQGVQRKARPAQVPAALQPCAGCPQARAMCSRWDRLCRL